MQYVTVFFCGRFKRRDRQEETEKERETERERQIDRQTDRQTKRARKRRRERESDRENERDIQHTHRRKDRGSYALFVCLFGFLTSSSTTRLYRGRAPRQRVCQFYVLPHMRQSWETMTSVSAGHIIR